MRVALDGLPLSRPLTGVGHYTLELARNLVREYPQDQFSVVGPRPFVAALKSPSDQSLKLVRPTLVPVIRFWWQFSLPRYLHTHQIEIFHGTNFELPSQGDCATVLTIHDLSTFTHPETHEVRNVKRARRRLPDAAMSASMIICPTEAVRQEIKELLGIPLDRVVSIHEAVRAGIRQLSAPDAERTKERWGIGDQFLLYVGTVEPRKNLLNLVKAFEQTTKVFDSLQLVIAGKRGWLVEDLFAYVKASPVGQRVIFTEYVSDTDLSALYSSCMLFVYPSRYEGFGLPPLEAMSCGAPVIASRIPSITEVVGSVARLVNPDDVADIENAIVELARSSGSRQRMSLAGVKRASEFSWANHATRVRAVYQEAFDRHRLKGKG